MTFDEAVQQFQPAPFDQLFIWCDTGNVSRGDTRDIMIVFLDDNIGYYQVHNISKNKTARQLTLDLQHNPWIVLDHRPTRSDHDWRIGDVYDIVQYVKELYLKVARLNDEIAESLSKRAGDML